MKGFIVNKLLLGIGIWGLSLSWVQPSCAVSNEAVLSRQKFDAFVRETGPDGTLGNEIWGVLSAACPTFPSVPVSTEYGKIPGALYTVNKNGAGLDAFRFALPDREKRKFFMVLAWPKDRIPVWSMTRLVACSPNAGPYGIQSELSLDGMEGMPWPRSYEALGLYGQLEMTSDSPVTPLHPTEKSGPTPPQTYLYAVRPEGEGPCKIFFGVMALTDEEYRKATLVAGRFNGEPNGMHNAIRLALGITTYSPAEMFQTAICQSDIPFIDYTIGLGVQVNDTCSLWLAAAYADTKTIAHLLSLGADPNRINDRREEAPLFALCDRNVLGGAHPDSLIKEGDELIPSAEVLVKAGAAINAVNPDQGSTALMTAIQHKRVALSIRLIELGADVTVRDADGKTALDYAREAGPMMRDVVSAIESKK